MNHSFSVEVAKEVGVLAATIFNSIGFWTEHNKANGAEQHDGRFWTYNSVAAWAELFPYATRSQIDLALKKLIAAGYVVTGRYNRSAYDRTLWYALGDKGEIAFRGNAGSISEKTEMEVANHEVVINKESVNNTVSKPDENIPYAEIIDALNGATGKNFRAVDSTKRLIRARWAEGYRVKDFAHVAAVKADEWRGTDMEKYLRPSTLFAASHFEGYLNQGRKPEHGLDGYNFG